MEGTASRIAARLRERLGALHVEVEDESHLHAGHAGVRERGGGHFRVLVVSPRFAGLGRVQAQRAVYQALDELMQGEIHALALRTLTPEAWEGEGGDAAS